MQISRFAGGVRAGLLKCGIAVDEHRKHAEPAAELDVRPGVADNRAGFGADVGKVRLRLIEQAGQRLAAIALILVVRAEVEAVHMGFVVSQFPLKLGMDTEDVFLGTESEGNASLIGDENDAQAGAIEACDSLGNAGKYAKFPEGGNVATLRKFLIYNSVAIKEDRAQRSG